MAVTPNRVIKLEVDGPEQSTVTRPHFRRGWKAGQIGAADGWAARVDPVTGSQVRVAGHTGTAHVPGDVWILNPVTTERIYGMVSGSAPGAILLPGDFVVPVNVKWLQIFRPPPATAGGGGSFVTVAPAMKRRVPRGIAWNHANNFLGADQAAYPPPADPDYPDTMPMDRVCSSNADFGANQGFGVTFGQRSEFWSNPNFMRIYFGGATPLQPGSHAGGAFCLTLAGSGRAILYERNAVSAWERRLVFQWAAPDNIPDGSHHIQIIPLATDRILFITRVTDQPAHTEIYGAGARMLAGAGATSNPTMVLYRDTPGQTGHQHLSTMTGIGKLRIDLRRDYRFPFVPWLVKYPVNGVVRDEPFAMPQGIEANVPIELITNGYTLGGATMTGVIRDADTGLALPVESGTGRFLTLAGKQQYYATFHFNASSNRNQTPVLFGYMVRSSANSVIRVTTPTTCRVREGSVTGPDIFPGHGSAEVKLRRHPNVGASLTGVSRDPEPMDILRLHDRRYCRLRVDVPTTGPSGDPRGYVILHAGETWQPRAQLRGRAGMDNVGWWDFSVPMVDLWVRVAKQMTWQHLDYSSDPLSTSFPKQKPVIMAVIRDLLIEAGISPDELDTPGWDDPANVRLFHSPTVEGNQWLVTPGSNIAMLIKRLAFDMLGKVVIHDPNAYQGDNLLRGLWRVIDPPQPAAGTGTWETPAVYPLSHSKAEFFVRRPAGAAGKVVEDEGALYNGIFPGAYVKDGSYVLYPEAPEKTTLTVTGHGGLLAKLGLAQNMYAFLWNPKAVDWDPASPTADPTSIDYMDRVEPLFVNDPNFRTPEALAWMAVRIARQALRGRLWCEWTAPLLFVQDLFDDLLGERRRPLRVYDQVTLTDEHGVPHPVMIRSTAMFWRGASQMWQYFQGILLDAH